MPDAELVEPRVFDFLPQIALFRHFIWRVVRIELPLSRDTCLVTGVGEEMTEGNFVGIHETESNVVTEVVLPSH